MIAKGQGASPGKATGPLALSAETALDLAARGTPPIFVRNEMDATDVPAIRAAAGVVIARGGITADGAVAARALGKPCIVGCATLVVRSSEVRVAKTSYPAGTAISMDGGSGEIHIEG
jgi:pyruvate,orthophosphate dikinase